MIYVLLLLFVVLTSQSSTRENLLKINLGTDVGLGVVLDGIFIRTLWQWPRMSWYSLRDGAVKLNLNSPKSLNVRSIDATRIVNTINYFAFGDTNNSDYIFEMPDDEDSPSTDYFSYVSLIGSQALVNDDIPNFYQGIFFTFLFALIPMLFACCWWCIISCTCCFCCCCCCCGRKSHNEEKKKKEMKPQDFEQRIKRRKMTQTVCRWFVFIYSITTLIVMIIMSFFAYAGHQGVSNSINTVNNNYEEFANFTNTVNEIPDTVNEATSRISAQLLDLVDDIIEIIPVNLTEIAECIPEILPDFDEMSQKINDLFDIDVDDFIDMSIIDNLEGNFTAFVSKIQTENLAELKELINDFSDLKNKVWGLLNNLTDALDNLQDDSDYPSNEQINEMMEALELIENEKENPLNQTFLTNAVDMTDNPGSYTTGEMLNAMYTIQNSLNRLDQIDIESLNTTINQIQNLGAPNTEKLEKQLEEFDTIQLDMENLINQVNTTFEGLQETISEFEDYLASINGTADKIYNQIVENLPDVTTIIRDLLALNNTPACVDSITTKIKKMNETLIVIPYKYGKMLDNILDPYELLFGEDGFLGNESLSEMLGGLSNLESFLEPLKEQLDTMMDTVTDFNFDDYVDFDSLNFDSLLSNMTGSLDTFNSSSYKDMLDSFNGSISDNLNPMKSQCTEMSDTLYYFKHEIKNANSSINDMITILELSPDHSTSCSTTGTCPDAGTLSAAKTNIKALNTTLYGTNYSETIDQLQSFNDSMKDIFKFSEFEDSISSVNSSLNSFSVDDTLSSIDSGNQSISDLEMGNFSAKIDDLLDSISNFTSGGNFSEQLEELSSYVDNLGIEETLQSLPNVEQLIKNYTNLIPVYLESFGSTLATPLNGSLDTVAEYIGYFTEGKDFLLENYIYRIDGFRLLIALFIILIIIPCPSLTIYTCCCYKRPCCLIFMSWFLCFVIICCWIVPLHGIPLAFLFDDHCENYDNYFEDAVNFAGESAMNLSVSNSLPESLTPYINESVISNFLINGITSDWANSIVNGYLIGDLLGTQIESALSGLSNIGGGQFGNISVNISKDDLNVTLEFEPIKIQNIVSYYFHPNGCDDENADYIDIIQNAFLNSYDNIYEEILKVITDGITLPMDFTWSPAFKDTIGEVLRPVIQNATSFLDYAKPFLGCERINNWFMIGYNSVCVVSRFAYIFSWAMNILFSILFLVVTCFSFGAYCFLEFSYTRDQDDKSLKFDQDEELDDYTDDEDKELQGILEED